MRIVLTPGQADRRLAHLPAARSDPNIHNNTAGRQHPTKHYWRVAFASAAEMTSMSAGWAPGRPCSSSAEPGAK